MKINKAAKKNKKSRNFLSKEISLLNIHTRLDLKSIISFKMKNISIIIPIFNESESIFKLIDEIFSEYKKKPPEVIIVNDGSTDDFVNKVHTIKEKSLYLFS